MTISPEKALKGLTDAVRTAQAFPKKDEAALYAQSSEAMERNQIIVELFQEGHDWDVNDVLSEKLPEKDEYLYERSKARRDAAKELKRLIDGRDEILTANEVEQEPKEKKPYVSVFDI